MDQNVEEQIIEGFHPFFGKTDLEIFRLLNVPPSVSKHRMYLLAMAILRTRQVEVEEFEKAEIQVKTIRLEPDGSPTESMSFRQIQFREIVTEEWETSVWHHILTRRFLFVVFRRDGKEEFSLERVLFWTMPVTDLATARDFWNDTKRKITRNDFIHFIKESDDRICHVRPKARDSTDLMETANGGLEKKKCYWLNAKYIRSILANSEKSIRKVRVIKRVA
ncbi:MAG: MutH/Sau3AI family endonuclease [Pyrinomonadaceae bacterium]